MNPFILNPTRALDALEADDPFGSIFGRVAPRPLNARALENILRRPK
jgi:hypothetical protein